MNVLVDSLVLSSFDSHILQVSCISVLCAHDVIFWNPAQRMCVHLRLRIDNSVVQFSQQASFLTGGLYMKHGEPGELLQVLLMHYLADNTTRKHLAVPQQVREDFCT